MEELQEAKRQRSTFRKQSIAVSDALAQVLSESYWQGPGGRRSRWPGRTPDVDQQERALVRAVEESDLFDAGWYLRKNLAVARDKMNPATHYVRAGDREGLNPSPRFNTRRYLQRHAGAPAAGLPALVHFLRSAPAAADQDAPAGGDARTAPATRGKNPGDDPGAGIHL